MSMQNKSDFEMVDHYIVKLQEFLSTGIGKQARLKEMMTRSDELMNGCTSSSCKSAIILVADIRELLDRHVRAATTIHKSDADLLRLACDWLLQLSSLYKEGLPEPSSLLREIKQLFALSIASFSASHDAGGAYRTDFFAEDSFFDLPLETQGLIDPFDEDPGLSSGLERLQRTVTHVKSAVSSRRKVSDPFSGDPEAIVDNMSISNPLNPEEGCRSETDIFSEDPALGLD